MDNKLTFSSSFSNQAIMEKVDEEGQGEGEVSREKNPSLYCISCEIITALGRAHTCARVNSLRFVSH